jgi:hypothetical protein
MKGRNVSVDLRDDQNVNIPYSPSRLRFPGAVRSAKKSPRAAQLFSIIVCMELGPFCK